MARPSNPSADPALDAAALLRRIGFFMLFVVVPIVAQVSRRSTVVFTPIAVVLLIVATGIDAQHRPLWSGLGRFLRAPAFLAGLLVLLWSALSIVWTPFPDVALARLGNLVMTIALTLAGYLALPDRMRSANLYLLPIGVGAAAVVAILIGLFGDALTSAGPEGDDSVAERGAVLLALFAWPAVAWLRSRQRATESLALVMLVAAALLWAPGATPLGALSIGVLAFALTSWRPATGVRTVALAMAGLLALAPLIPFLLRPIVGLVLNPTASSMMSLTAWRRVVVNEPLRLVTGHGFETALRSRLVGMLPQNAPSTFLFEFWYELGIVGAFAAAFALYASATRAGREHTVLTPCAMATFATAYTIGAIGVGLTAIWWITSLAIAALAFVTIERGQFRSKRPKVSLLNRVAGSEG